MNKQTAAHKALATIVKEQRAIASANKAAGNNSQAEYWQSQLSVLWTVAEKYAEQTGVDKIKFLADCGIDAS